MKKNVWLKMTFLLVLLLCFLAGNTVQAEGNVSLSEGTYTVGKEISIGLNKFTVSSGEAGIEVYRNEEYLVGEYLDSEKSYTSNQMTINLKAGDEVDVYMENGASNLKVEKLAKADLKVLTVGYYEVGTDLPAGTYLIEVDHPVNEDDLASIDLYDSKNNYKSFAVIFEDDEPVELKVASGDKIYISYLMGTMSFKEKIIVPTSLKLSKSSLSITPSQTYKVTTTVSPSNAKDKTVVWKSSNTKVATVDASGNVKGIASGSATITATAKTNTKAVKSLTVKVSAKTVKLNKTSLSVMTGKTSTLTATVTPGDSTDKTVTWKSSNTKVATVDSKGKVTGKAKGTATITAAVKNAKSVTAKVTVTSPIAAKSVKMSKTSATITKGKTLTLSATVSPSNTTDKTLKWKSSNTKVAKVDSKGKVTAVAAGSAKITATTTNGKTTTATITVPSSMTLKTFTELRPSKINWMKYYFDGSVLKGNIEREVYTNNYVYVVPSIHMSFSPTSFDMGIPETDITLANIPAPLTQNKATPIYEFNWNSEKDMQIGNAYLRSINGTITTPAGTFKNVVHIEEKFYDLSTTFHYYFAPGYGLVKVVDSNKRLSYELRSYK